MLYTSGLEFTNRKDIRKKVKEINEAAMLPSRVYFKGYDQQTAWLLLAGPFFF